LFDIDGDALPDRVYSNPDSANFWSIFFNSGNYFSLLPVGWGKIGGDTMDVFRRSVPNDGFANITSLDIFDMDGDGLVDVVSGGTNGNFLVYRNNGNGFDHPEDWKSPTPLGEASSRIRESITPFYPMGDTTIETRDINGDGLPDRIFIRADCDFSVFLNNGKKDGLDGFDDPVVWENHTCGWDYRFDDIDLHHNIMKDLDTKESTVISDLIDMNGDGLVDRVTRHTNPYNFRVYWNRGDGFETYELWKDPILPLYHPGLGKIRKFVNDEYITQSVATIEDINGDGLPDRIASGQMGNANPLKVYLNTGSGFNSTPIYWTNPSNRPIHVNSLNYPNWGGQGKVQGGFQDINGDGLNDFIWTGTYDIYGNPSSNPIYNSPVDGWAVYYNSGPVPDLLTSVENGIGGRTEIHPLQNITITICPLLSRPSHL